MLLIVQEPMTVCGGLRLVNRMMEEGVPKCVIRWFKSFLEDRKAHVRLGQGKSK